MGAYTAAAPQAHLGPQRRPGTFSGLGMSAVNPRTPGFDEMSFYSGFLRSVLFKYSLITPGHY